MLQGKNDSFFKQSAINIRESVVQKFARRKLKRIKVNKGKLSINEKPFLYSKKM